MKTSLRNPFARVLLATIFLFSGASGLHAQDQPATAQPEAPAGPTYRVGTITIKFVGMANVSEQVVRANMALRENTDLDEALIDRDIRSLYKTQLFEFIEAKREQAAGNVVNLVFEVTPKFRVLAVKFEGLKAYKDRRLMKEIKSVANGALDERQIKDDAQKIYEFYQKAGYNQAQVTYSIDRNRSTGFGTITYKVREGARVRIAAINFVGNDHVKAGRLRKEMETRKWHMFSWLTGGGRLKDDEFDSDLGKLRDYYNEQGYLDVEIAEDKITFDYPKPDRLVITIRVNEGRQYKLGDVSFKGNKIYSDRILRFVPRQKKGMIFVPSKLDKDVETLEDFYGQVGYLQTRVRLVRKPNLATGDIDVEYQITESEKFQVESIVIEGNTKTKSVVILRELVLGPGDVFDSLRMKISKLRLENTRFFEDPVNVTDESTNIPGRRNLKISVREARTGNLTFGAGFSSLEKAVVFAEVTQSNFDLFNRRSFFQGDGQKFRLRFQIGSQSSEIILAFEEPYLFERELALGFQIYRQTSDYNSAFYQEIRTGGEVYLRKRLFNWLEGRLSYTYQVIDVANVTAGAPLAIQLAEGNSTTSKVTLALTQDSRDKIINTTRGNYATMELGVAGGPLGGSNNYYSLEFRGSKFFPIAEFQEQVLSVIGRIGVEDSFGKSNRLTTRTITDPTTGLPVTTLPYVPGVPFYDRHFLGGPQDLRGFEFRTVGPKDANGEPIGGNSYGFVSLEYSMDVVKPVRFALFYDAGFVNKNAYDFSPASYNDNFGIGLRLFVAGAPLSLDFGVPLTGDKYNKKGTQFNFSFGTRF
ncbi:outer membrane protein assembly factor BamA [Opitutus sp. GAS368]|uniref:outer membrane protein assembly factor BamA n=1 Tax=Opitutus sp. GAS368 TaxID=1882749 RepID=UPI00087D7382|nr:outer membrane protein assembly factor BamA [Opitutus sp. GAS368]SDS31162.1 Beta-barrel assembly machine subunit BamA [Opitutus sp. GAS368]